LLELIFVTAVIALISAIAVPTVFRSKLAANETAAIGTLRLIHTGQLTYTLTCGYGLYASSFPDLADPTSEGFLPMDLTINPTPQKSGYLYQLQAGPSGQSGLVDCHGAPTATEYYVSAIPITFQGTGNRAFATNHNSVIWQDTGGAAPVEPFTAGGTVSSID
jgi:type II secretory pathway pseudopilin PulG